MRRLIVLSLAIVAATTAVAKKKEKQELPTAVLAARYVYVTGWHGNEFQFRSLPEEREAIVAVQTALRNWGRYRVVYRPEEADIMLVVKPGYLGMVQSGVNVGVGGPIGTGPDPTRGPGSTRVGTDYGAEATNPDDYLMVCILPRANAQDANYIWRRGQHHGLSAVQGKVPLFEEFRKAVDESDKANAANKQP